MQTSRRVVPLTRIAQNRVDPAGGVNGITLSAPWVRVVYIAGSCCAHATRICTANPPTTPGGIGCSLSSPPVVHVGSVGCHVPSPAIVVPVIFTGCEPAGPYTVH